MNIYTKKIITIVITITTLALICFGIVVLDPELISIIISGLYVVFLVLTKTTNRFDKHLFIIRFEKSFFLLIATIVLIIQLTMKEVDRAILILLMLLMILVICYLVFSWIYEKIKTIRELKTEKLKSELLLLKSQINPHFFFNTLNNLYGLSIEKSDETPRVILKLSEMLRYTIYEGIKEKVSLKSEIQNLKNYVDLHKIRHFDKLDINFKIDLEDENISIAPLLLINLLENAFKHGVEILNDKAYIHVHIKEKNNKLDFVIENNYDKEIAISETGLGLENLRRRLELIYPNKHSLKITNKNSKFRVELMLEIL